MKPTHLPKKYLSMLRKLKIKHDLTLDELFTDFEDRVGLAWTDKFDEFIHSGNTLGAYQMLFECPEAAQVSHSMVHSVSAEWLNKMIEIIPRDGTVLDIGCGAGAQSLYLAKARPDITVYGIDQSSHAILRSQERAALLGLNNAKFFESNLLHELPEQVKDETNAQFDVVLSHCIFQELAQFTEHHWHQRLEDSYGVVADVKMLMSEAYRATEEQTSKYAVELIKYLAHISKWSRHYVCTLERLPSIITSTLYASAARTVGLEIQWTDSLKIYMHNYAHHSTDTMPLWVMKKAEDMIDPKQFIDSIYQMYYPPYRH